MSINVEEIKKEMSKEKFRELAEDMKPVIMDMDRILNKHGIECLSSLTMSTDGYFRFDIHDTEWEFKRANKDAKSVISFQICEEV